MKTLRIFISILCLVSAQAFAETDPAFSPVVKLFSAMSDIDHLGMRNSVTDDFSLLEHGEVWDINDLISVVNPSKYKRENYFKVISSDVREDIALINYWNKATFRSSDSSKDVIWLESVVAVKVEDGWRLQQMHSTRVDPQKIPKSVAFAEMR